MFLPFVIVFVGLYYLGYIDPVLTWLECKFSSPETMVESPLLNIPEPGMVKESLYISSEGPIAVSNARTSFFSIFAEPLSDPPQFTEIIQEAERNFARSAKFLDVYTKCTDYSEMVDMRPIRRRW